MSNISMVVIYLSKSRSAVGQSMPRFLLCITIHAGYIIDKGVRLTYNGKKIMKVRIAPRRCPCIRYWS
jgi:hypothetical protein